MVILRGQIFDENDIISQFEMNLENKSLMSSSNGNLLRKWNKINGSLIWESEQFENNNSQNTKYDHLIYNMLNVYAV